MSQQEKVLKLKVDQQDVFFIQRKDMFCISLDTILLTNFISFKKLTKQVIDFGTNNGAIAILLALKYDINVLGIEIQKEAVVLAQKNVALNQLTQKIQIINEDIKIYAQTNENDNSKKVDAIVCNPPFFIINPETRLKIEPLKVGARHETFIDLATIVNSATKLLKVKGKLFMIYQIQRMDDLFNTLKANNFMVKRMQIVYPKGDKNANWVLIEAVYQTNAGLIVEPPLICHNPDGSYHKDIAKWYNRSEK